MKRRPPTSRLFPYTTLFRSDPLGRLSLVGAGVQITRASIVSPFFGFGNLNKFFDPSANSIRQDRKSTRLNSSHSQISYAVFCLKKKTPSDNNQSNPQMHRLG